MDSLVGLTNSTVSGEENQSPSDSFHGPYSLKEATDGLQFIYNFTDSSYSQSTSTDDPFLIHNSTDDPYSGKKSIYLIHNSSNSAYPQNKTLDRPYTVSSLMNTPDTNFSDPLQSNFTNYTGFANDFNTSFTESWTSLSTSTEGSYSIPVAFEIIPPLIVAIGIIGNILSLCVLSRKKFRNLSVSVYLRGLAVADVSSLLISHSFLNLLEKTTGNYMRDFQGWACKIFIWLHLSLPWISSWLVVCISVERVIVVYTPHKAKRLCTTTKAYMVTTSLYLFILLGNVHSFFKYDIHVGYCSPVEEIYYVALVGVAIALTSIAPFLVIVVCNLVIVCTLIKMSKVQKALSHDKSSSQNSKNLTVMLVLNCILFLILTSPYNIVLMVYFFSDKAKFDLNFINVTYELAFSNHAINFFLYVICGSLFRKELLYMLKCAEKELASSERSVSSTQNKTEISKV